MTEKHSSLHTKYRPKTFDEIVGHEEVIESLKKIVKNKRAKSFIFTGPSGVGKTTIARILANAFAHGKGTQANVIEVDAATHTGIEQARSLTATANYRALGSSPVKAIIVDEAHRLSSAAWSSLLKSIEEPPAHVYWMFSTTDPGKIPDTIKTRCLKFDLKSLTEDEIVTILEKVCKDEKLEIEGEIIDAIAEECEGSPRQALTFLESCVYAESASEAKKIMRSAASSKEVIDLCRYLIAGKAFSWGEAMRYVKPLLENMEPESVRIVVSNYFAKALLDTKDNKRALPLLHMLECFSEPYNQSDKSAPLLISIGEALGLGE